MKNKDGLIISRLIYISACKVHPLLDRVDIKAIIGIQIGQPTIKQTIISRTYKKVSPEANLKWKNVNGRNLCGLCDRIAPDN